MTTTPDSRIRADWHLDALPGPECALQPIDTSTTATPDTSTTAGKADVMNAYARGESIQCCPRKTGADVWTAAIAPTWNWPEVDYRIAPPPVARTALQRARDLRSRLDVVDPMAAAGILCCLLTDIDYAPAVDVLERRISWGAADLSALPKGRYRLVRDDA